MAAIVKIQVRREYDRGVSRHPKGAIQFGSFLLFFGFGSVGSARRDTRSVTLRVWLFI
jgi:hypothetical protein